VAERSEFELPVPVSKLSDDCIELELATTRRGAAVKKLRQAANLVLGRKW